MLRCFERPARLLLWRLSILMVAACAPLFGAHADEPSSSPFARGQKLPGDLSDLLKLANNREGKQGNKADPPPKQRPAQAKSEIPDLATQEKTLKEIVDIFGHPDTAAEKLSLAKKMMIVSSDEKDPDVRYTLIRYGGTLAIEAGSSLLALQAVDELGHNYQFDASAMKAAVLDKVLSKSTAAEILTTSLRQFDLCLANNHYAVAKRFGQIAYRAAELSGNTDGVDELRERAARLTKLQAAFDAMKPSISVLKTRPDDVAANRKVGEFFCHMKGNWRQGLPFLVAGDHPVAKLESARPQDAKAKNQIADLWWAEAEKIDSPQKENLQRRASKWYQAALPGLKGLSRVAAQKRIRKVPSKISPKEAPSGPVLSKTDSKEAQRVVAELFRDDFKNAKTASAKSALAKRILQTGRETKDDPAVRAALLKVARDTAALAGDAKTGLAAIDEMANHQQINASDMKATVLATVVKSVGRLDRQRELIPRIGAAFEQAIADGEIDAAKRLGNLSASIMRRTKDYAGEKKVKARIKELQSLAKDYEAAKAAKATLRTRPSDPAANLALGRFLCFIKGDWDQGLKKLALGNDPVLKRLAEQELAKPADAASQAKLGSGWWEWSESAKPTTKRRTQEHAADWYRKALPSLAGLARVKAESRLKKVANKNSNALPVKKWIDLFKYIDPKKHAIKGNWSWNNGSLEVKGRNKPNRLTMPVRVTGYYECHLEFTRLAGDQEVVSVHLPVKDDRWVEVVFGNKCGIGPIDGKHWHSNATLIPYPLRNGRRHSAQITVDARVADRVRIRVVLNRRPIVDWSGKLSSLRPKKPRAHPTIRFGTWGIPARYHVARIRVLDGEAVVVKARP